MLGSTDTSVVFSLVTGAGACDVEASSLALESGVVVDVGVSSSLVGAGEDDTGGGFTGGVPGVGVGVAEVEDSDAGGVTAVVEPVGSADVSGADDSPMALVAVPSELGVGSALHANANTATHDKHRLMPAL